MRVLIFGGTGMLGHKLWHVFRERFDTSVAARGIYTTYQRYGLFDSERFLGGTNAADTDSVVRSFVALRPDVVVNAVGIIKQLPIANDPLVTLSVNSVFPHRLALLCRTFGARFIHVSTDCVFSGRKGMYSEEDVADSEDLYGRSKLLGEVSCEGCLTLRTSVIGRELETTNGLVEWFLSNHGRVISGYMRAMYSGFPSLLLAQITADVIEKHPNLSGIYHVASAPISKYELLCLLREAYQVSIKIEPNTDVTVDRTLDSTRFNAATGFLAAPWPKMVDAMVRDPTPYESWRNRSAF